MKRICLLCMALCMILTAVAPLTVVADDTAAKTEINYVTDGLVALYEASYNTANGFDADADYWTDMSGNGNDITDIDISDSLRFTDKGLWTSAKVVYFPASIRDLINTNCYTVELKVSDLEITGGNFATLINNHCEGNRGNDNFSWFIRTSNGELELKNAGNDRVKAKNGSDLVNGKTIAITFDLAAKECKMYSDGTVVATTTLKTEMALDAALLFVGNDDAGKSWNGNIHSVRFYDRALTEAEVAANADVTEGVVEVSAPKTGIQYVTDGLFALYEANYNTANGFDANATSWTDLSGKGNNIEDMSIGDTLKFTDKGLEMSATKVFFPESIMTLLNSDCYTIEFKINDFELTGNSFATLLNDVQKTGTEHISLFVRAASGELELKTNGNARPKVADGRNLVNGKTVTISFDKNAKAIKMYSDGVLIDSKTGDFVTMGLVETLYIGNNDANKSWNGNIQSVRFYDRALTDAEVAQNAAVKVGYIAEEDGETPDATPDQTPDATPDQTPEGSGSNPPTGDVNIFFTIFACAVIALSILVVSRRKARQ